MKTIHKISLFVAFVALLILGIYVTNNVSIPLGHMIFFLLPILLFSCLLFPVIKNRSTKFLIRKQYRFNKSFQIIAKIVVVFFVILLLVSSLLFTLSFLDLIKGPKKIDIYNVILRDAEDLCFIDALIDNKNDIQIKVNDSMMSKSRCDDIRTYLDSNNKKIYTLYYYEYLDIVDRIE